MTKITNWGSDDPAEVAKGGTGLATGTTAYAPIFTGTTATGAFQVGTAGTADQVLTSNGAGALPTFQDAGGGGSYTYISSATASDDATIEFTGLSTTYISYMIIIFNCRPATESAEFRANVSPDSGTTWRSGDSKIVRDAGNDEQYNSGFILSYNQGNGSSDFCSLTMNLYAPAQAVSTSYSTYGGYQNNIAAASLCTAGGLYATAEAHNALKFSYSSGNISVGEFYLYGISAT